jgi:hypothetical protein
MQAEQPTIGIPAAVAAEHARRTAPPIAEQAPTGAPGDEPQQAAADFVAVPSLWWRVRSFLGALAGPRVDSDEYRLRMLACQACRDVDVRHKRYGDILYCGACGCPRWRYSRLTKRNRMRLAICPKGRHPGQNGTPQRCKGCGG